MDRLGISIPNLRGKRTKGQEAEPRKRATATSTATGATTCASALDAATQRIAADATVETQQAAASSNEGLPAGQDVDSIRALDATERLAPLGSADPEEVIASTAAHAATEHVAAPLKLDSLDDVAAAFEPLQGDGKQFCKVFEASQVLLHGQKDAVHKLCTQWGVKRCANKQNRQLNTIKLELITAVLTLARKCWEARENADAVCTDKGDATERATTDVNVNATIADTLRSLRAADANVPIMARIVDHACSSLECISHKVATMCQQASWKTSTDLCYDQPIDACGYIAADVVCRLREAALAEANSWHKHEIKWSILKATHLHTMGVKVKAVQQSEKRKKDKEAEANGEPNKAKKGKGDGEQPEKQQTQNGKKIKGGTSGAGGSVPEVGDSVAAGLSSRESKWMATRCWIKCNMDATPVEPIVNAGL